MEVAPLSMSPEVTLFETNRGARIFQIPLQEFPILCGYAYLVLVDYPQESPYRVMIDSGSGFGDSNLHLEAGFRRISQLIGESIGFEHLTHIFVTHGHIDHFGGLAYVRPRTHARIGVHELDLRTLTNYEERLTVVARRLEAFLTEAGIAPERRASLIEMYMLPKSLFHSIKVDFTFEAVDMCVGPFEFLHVPGHCAGHVVIRLHDMLFSGDHVLDGLSPHQSPEHLTLYTGLGHYLKSLDALEAWAGEVRITLGGHRGVITDLPSRLQAIRQVHAQRLKTVLEMLEQPHTIAELSHALFGEVHGYNVLLALEETGAHVEYLAQRGQLRISNLDEIKGNHNPVTIRYQKLALNGEE